ncbi:hypothetical protein ES703_74189 [subsurface metagenome]
MIKISMRPSILRLMEAGIIIIISEITYLPKIFQKEYIILHGTNGIQKYSIMKPNTRIIMTKLWTYTNIIIRTSPIIHIFISLGQIKIACMSGEPLSNTTSSQVQ